MHPASALLAGAGIGFFARRGRSFMERPLRRFSGEVLRCVVRGRHCQWEKRWIPRRESRSRESRCPGGVPAASQSIAARNVAVSLFTLGTVGLNHNRCAHAHRPLIAHPPDARLGPR